MQKFDCYKTFGGWNKLTEEEKEQTEKDEEEYDTQNACPAVPSVETMTAWINKQSQLKKGRRC
jgi:hypothetical protein